uniref:Uncharacterized protein n=1 Tax=Sphaerodactylus townsendi TaxID=933632 RepID=A0ACB8F548_9SAUR
MHPCYILACVAVVFQNAVLVHPSGLPLIYKQQAPSVWHNTIMQSYCMVLGPLTYMPLKNANLLKDFINSVLHFFLQWAPKAAYVLLLTSTISSAQPREIG